MTDILGGTGKGLAHFLTLTEHEDSKGKAVAAKIIVEWNVQHCKAKSLIRKYVCGETERFLQGRGINGPRDVVHYPGPVPRYQRGQGSNKAKDNRIPMNLENETMAGIWSLWFNKSFGEEFARESADKVKDKTKAMRSKMASAVSFVSLFLKEDCEDLCQSSPQVVAIYRDNIRYLAMNQRRMGIQVTNHMFLSEFLRLVGNSSPDEPSFLDQKEMKKYRGRLSSWMKSVGLTYHRSTVLSVAGELESHSAEEEGEASDSDHHDDHHPIVRFSDDEFDVSGSTIPKGYKTSEAIQI